MGPTKKIKLGSDEIVTQFRNYEKTQYWTIGNYFAFADRTNGAKYSPPFKLEVNSNEIYSFSLELWPKGVNEDGYISLYLNNESAVDVTLYYTLFIVKADNTVHSIISNESRLFNSNGGDNSRGKDKAVKISQLKENEQEFLSGKTLKFGCTINITKEITTVYSDMENHLKSTSNMQETIARFFDMSSEGSDDQYKMISDFTIVCNGQRAKEELPCNKFILLVRSPVF